MPTAQTSTSLASYADKRSVDVGFVVFVRADHIAERKHGDVEREEKKRVEQRRACIVRGACGVRLWRGGVQTNTPYRGGVELSGLIAATKDREKARRSTDR